MSTSGALAAASLLLAALGAAATAFRSALLIVGEEGLAGGDAATGDPGAERLLRAVRDPASRHPFSLWLGGIVLKVGSALFAGAAGLGLVLSLGAAGGAAAAGWTAGWALILFAFENAAARAAIAAPRRVLRWSGTCRLALRAFSGPARLADRLGRLLFADRYNPEALMDIRFGSEEGILDVIEEGAEHGTIDPTEERMIEGVLRFGEMTVSGGMTPWAEVVSLKAGRPFEEVTAAAAEAGFSRYPVLAPSGEEVLGILPSRRLLGREGAARWERLLDAPEKILERPLYVPQSMKVSDLFRQFQRTRVHLAVAIDEHGKLCGVITLHDLLEKIVGRLAEGTEVLEGPEWEKDGALSVPASTPVRVLREEYGIDIPLGSTYETAGGFALDRLQSVPEGQVTFRACGWRITVAETERYRIKRLRFERTGPTGTT